MRGLKALLPLFPLLAIAGTGTAQLHLSPPLRYEDGTLIATSGGEALSGYRYEWSKCVIMATGVVFGVRVGQTITALTDPVLVLPSGSWCVRAYARTVAGAESNPTSAIQVDIRAPFPPAINTK